MANAWFETVAEAQRRAKKRLPKSVYGALVAGSERGLTLEDNVAAFDELGFAPHTAGQPAERDLATRVLGQDISLPVIISPTGVQAVHPDGEVAVARAAAARGTAMGLSSFASKPVEEVVAANPQTFFQIYWAGTQGADRRAGWSGPARPAPSGSSPPSTGRSRWAATGAARTSRRSSTLKEALRFAPEALTHPRWLTAFVAHRPHPRPHRAEHAGSRRSRRRPSSASTASGCRRRRRPGTTSPGCASSGAGRSCSRASPGSTTPSGRSTPAPPRSRCPTTAATTSTARRRRSACLPAVADAVGDQIEVLLDGGIRRGSDVVKALALGARAVMIGRAYLWGLGANGQAGVENVLDILRGGIDSALLGLGRTSVRDLDRRACWCPTASRGPSAPDRPLRVVPARSAAAAEVAGTTRSVRGVRAQPAKASIAAAQKRRGRRGFGWSRG